MPGRAWVSLGGGSTRGGVGVTSGGRVTTLPDAVGSLKLVCNTLFSSLFSVLWALDADLMSKKATMATDSPSFSPSTLCVLTLCILPYLQRQNEIFHKHDKLQKCVLCNLLGNKASIFLIHKDYKTVHAHTQ